jgi:hypothetical protein
MNEWRERFLNIPEVEYKDGTYSIKENNLLKKATELASASWRP